MAQVLLPPLLAAVLLVGGGCGVDAPPSASERVPRSEAPSSQVPSDPGSASSSRTVAPSPPGKGTGDRKDRGVGTKLEPPSSAVARATSEARTHLLSASVVPAAGEGVDWTVAATRPESDPVGACQRASLVDIGALRAVVRVFDGPEDSGLRARQVVARFADKKSAWRAHEVLRSWRDRCEEVLDGAAEVGPMVEVALSSATGAHYRADHGPKKAADHTGLGIVRHRGWISIVDITATESDYPSTWTRRAVRRIAATF